MKKIILFTLALTLFSCNDDDAPTTSPIDNNADAVFDHYTIESTTTQNDTGYTSGSFVTANLQDEKFFSETAEQFINGVGQGQSTAQHYFYENGLLVKRVYGGDARDFFYDAQGSLIAVNWEFNGLHNYYRFVNVGPHTVYFEKINLPYNDPAVELMSRIVLQFDDNDNVIQAGRDSDLDGEANWHHTFDYNAANNLTTIHEYGGNAIDIQYAAIKDNFAKLAFNTYGKRNLMVYQAECYANLTLESLRHSPDLRMADTQDELIEIQAVPYYFRKTKTMALGDGENTTVTTFYFQ